MKKLLALSFGPGAVMALLFVFSGDYFEEILKADEFNRQFNSSSAWLVAIALMISDLFLPIPASAIMSAIGSKYGLVTAFFINTGGLLMAGLTAYFLAKTFSRKGSHFICSDQELNEYSDFFNKWGGLAIIISRALPILPEVTSLMAGFTKMNFKKYFSSLFLGSAAVSLLYSWIGSSSAEEPFWGIAIAVAIPLVLWIPVNKLIHKNKTKTSNTNII